MPIETRWVKVGLSAAGDEGPVLEEAARALAAGGLVVFPTETVYGIAANARDPSALRRLNEAKRRPEGKPYSYHVSSREEAAGLAGPFPEMAEKLARRFWPGPLTLVVPGRDGEEVGIRFPSHPVARRLIAMAKVAVVAPSANRSGEPTPATAEEIHRIFNGIVDFILDAGPSDLNRASTIVRVTEGSWEILREGDIPGEEIRALLNRLLLFVCTGNSCRSPMAEALLRKLLAEKLEVRPERLANHGFTLLSAGTAALEGQPASRGAVEAVRSLGGRMEGHISRSVTPGLVDRAERIFVMSRHHLESILDIMPEARGKLALLDPDGDIPDPLGGTPEEYRACADRIYDAVKRLSKRL